MDQRRCSKCRQWKDVDEFPWKNKMLGWRHSTCKDCRNEAHADYYRRTRETRLEYKYQRQVDKREEARQYVFGFLSENVCTDCGESDPLVLTFDHVRGRKKMNVSQMVNQGYSIKAIQKEIAKCDVRCANCHMRKEKVRRGTAYPAY